MDALNVLSDDPRHPELKTRENSEKKSRLGDKKSTSWPSMYHEATATICLIKELSIKQREGQTNPLHTLHPP